MKRQPVEWEEIFAHHIYNKGFISKIYELTQLSSKKQKHSDLKKGQMICIDIFPKKIYRCPTGTLKGAQYH